ncbi:MAG TPA: hypothetical protein PK631_03620, partial [Erysipelotrichaceae bacterium]|nr:hypothetical protein [Erysipelotrichaceae bacterium]
PDILLTFGSNLMMMTVVAAKLKLPVLAVVLALVIFLIFAVGRSFFGVIIDCKKPRHNFTSEYQVVKSNPSIFYDIVYNFVLLIPSALSLMILSDLPLLVIFLINLLFHAGLSYGFYRYIREKDFKLAQKIF